MQPIQPIHASGAAARRPDISPASSFPNPVADFWGGFNITWRLDIYRQLRNARDAAGLRYLAAIDGRNYFVTRLVAEIAENYYRLCRLTNGLRTWIE